MEAQDFYQSEEEAQVLPFQSQGQQQQQSEAQNSPTTAPVPAVPGNPFAKMALGLLPFTPLPLSGPDAWMGYTRMSVYALAAYLAWSKSRRLSYLLMGAGGLSAATSLAHGSWQRVNGK